MGDVINPRQGGAVGGEVGKLSGLGGWFIKAHFKVHLSGVFPLGTAHYFGAIGEGVYEQVQGIRGHLVVLGDTRKAKTQPGVLADIGH